MSAEVPTSSPETRRLLPPLLNCNRRQVIVFADAKIPPRARAIAILEHDVLRLISPSDKNVVIVKTAQSA